MKLFIILITLINFCYSQATSFSVYGVGERVNSNDPISIGIGSATFFSGNSKGINNDSSSSLWRSALTRFSIHSGINYLKVPGFSEQLQQNLTSFSVLFPVGNKKVFGFGLQPTFRTNSLNFSDDEFTYIGSDKSPTNEPIGYKSNYQIDGGISQIYFIYSQKINSNLSGGIKYAVLFGNQIFNDELYTYDIVLDTVFTSGILINEIQMDTTSLFVTAINANMTAVNKHREFKGSSIAFEARYLSNKHEFVLNLLTYNKNRIITLIEQNINNFISTNTTSTYSEDYSSNFGFGYKYQISKKSGVIIELHNKSPFNIPKSASIFRILPPKERSLHVGGFYRMQNSKIGFWNNITYRFGAYSINNIFSDAQYKNSGLTLGIGLEYLNNSQSADIAIRFGNKESEMFKSKKENYISFHIGLTTGEKWFMKRRRK